MDSKASENQNVTQDVAQNVAQEHTKTLAEIIIAEIRKNEKVTREQIAEKAGVSKKTVEREIKKMGNVHYVGRGYSGAYAGWFRPYGHRRILHSPCRNGHSEIYRLL